MMITSGTSVKTVNLIEAPSGALIYPGTECMVVGLMRDVGPMIYLVETLADPEFEQEEFYCRAVDLAAG